MSKTKKRRLLVLLLPLIPLAASTHSLPIVTHRVATTTHLLNQNLAGHRGPTGGSLAQDGLLVGRGSGASGPHHTICGLVLNSAAELLEQGLQVKWRRTKLLKSGNRSLDGRNGRASDIRDAIGDLEVLARGQPLDKGRKHAKRRRQKLQKKALGVDGAEKWQPSIGRVAGGCKSCDDYRYPSYSDERSCPSIRL